MPELENKRIKNILEALLFVTKKPVTLEEMATAIETHVENIQVAMAELTDEYKDRGFRIVEVAGGYEMATIPENSPYIEKLLYSPIETTLSAPALEALSIVAYKQPVTKAEIEKIRGVSSESVIRTLLEKGLIEEIGRGESVGRPILYGTTQEFLRHFGLKDLKSLPPLMIKESEELRRSQELHG